MKTLLIKPNTTLGKKVCNYIDWRYNGTRSCCVITCKGGYLKVTTRCHRKDHYPVNLRNKYRRHTVHTEYVNQRQMNDLWKRIK